MRKTDIKITIFTLLVLGGGAFWAFSASASEITIENVIGLVNQEREMAGLVPLVENGNLSRAAQKKAQDMLEKNYFSHTSPEGLTPWYWIEKAGYDYKFAGENLAINFKTAEKQNKALMDSATHRKNILGEQFNEVGVAVASGTINGKETIITVQQFGNRTGAVALPEKKKEPVREKEATSETKRAVLIDSGLLAGKSTLIGSAGNKVAIFKNEINSFLRKAGGALDASFLASANGAAISLMFVVMVGSVLEILRRFHGIDMVGPNKQGALHTISTEEYEKLFRNLPADIGKMQIIYLHQMKRRE
ncbi:MAG: hypothetical protein UW95_C0003G0065 [Parcubacteria group bacterium GW2011_GWC1_45_14]|nr:MAG: hypothetical protein UW87_C0002G0054 [Candidatus Moranbacteria bacterium GW2011_GWC2_45_10]KKT95223.1 MAG: hypothetical protein UW95_C0003G0065 [Parcubacteria group bacterium GW2011_GWC1_45_14]